MQSDHSRHRKDWYRCGADPETMRPPSPPADELEHSEASFPKPAAGPAQQDPPLPTAGAGARDEKNCFDSAEPYWQAVAEQCSSRQKTRNVTLAISVLVLCITAVLVFRDWFPTQEVGTAMPAGTVAPGDTNPGDYDSVDAFFNQYYTNVSGRNNIPQTEARADLRIHLASLPTAELAVQDIYEQLSPSVVGIRAESEQGAAWGTGLVIAADGYILTNNHIIDTKDTAQVHFADGTALEAMPARATWQS